MAGYSGEPCVKEYSIFESLQTQSSLTASAHFEQGDIVRIVDSARNQTLIGKQALLLYYCEEDFAWWAEADGFDEDVLLKDCGFVVDVPAVDV